MDKYVTDKNGQFTTKEYVCDNDWTIREITPSEGYLLDSTIHKVGAEPQLYTVEHNQTANDVTEQVMKGNIAIIKHTDDGETQIETPENGATFEIYLKSSGSFDSAEEDERDVIVCDENGFGQTKEMVSIRPTYFYDVTTCTGANTSHTFSSTNSKCARCGYVRTYIIPTLLTPMAKNTQITLTARTNHTVSSISMSVKTPNGATTNLGTVTNTNSISKVYTPTVAAHPNDLYTVTVTAVSADGVTTSSTWTFRTY